MSPNSSRKKQQFPSSVSKKGRTEAKRRRKPVKEPSKPRERGGAKPQGGLKDCLAVMDGISDPAWVKDRRGVFRAVNLAWTKLIGKAPEEVVGRPETEVFGDELARKLHKQDLETIRSGTPRRVEECFNIKGGPTWFDTVITPYLDEKGAPAGVIGIARNITQRKHMEERFLRTQRMESLGALASGIAHDLNNILGPILMSASLLDENIQQESNRELVSIIKEAAQRGADIVNQVLTFARGTRGQRKPLEPRLLVKQIERILQKVMPKSITFVTQLSSDLFNITGDATQLHQVFMNLCVNARDAMPGGGTLTLAGYNAEIGQAEADRNRDARPGRYVCIAVADTGVGVPEAIRTRIFDPFFTTKDVGKGTGLGLSTALAIVKNHGGFVTLDSEVGKGSIFAVYLPATERALVPEKPVPQAPLPSGQGELVLVVDDELPICKMVQTILGKKSYRVLTALSGRDALRLFAENRAEIRAVITDLAMPEMNGLELIKALKAKDPDLPIIASTGQSSEHRYHELGPLDVAWQLSKPYGAQQLLSVVREAVAKRK